MANNAVQKCSYVKNYFWKVQFCRLEIISMMLMLSRVLVSAYKPSACCCIVSYVSYLS
jgi:hypothetical protein